MKKVNFIFTHFIGVLSIAMVLFFLLIDIQILEPEEQQKLKEGKLFWQWDSNYGPLTIHYIEKGEGSNHLLLLHAFRSHSYTWKALIDPLAEAGYHVWAIDTIGFGLSDKPEHAVYNVDFFIQQVKDFMNAKGIKKAHLAGNSMGGGLALSFTLAYPEQVDSLILISALGYPLDLPFYLSFCKYISHFWVPFLTTPMIRYTLKQIFYNGEQVTDEQVEAYSLPYRLPGGINATLLTLQQFDNEYLAKMGQLYSSLSHPTLVIWGDHDILIPTSHYEKFLKDFPHAERLLIPCCGHIPQEEKPNEVLEAILHFLEKSH